MNNILFASDLDNTLLFSYKHRQPDDCCMEYLDGKAQGYMTRTTLDLLPQARKKTLFIPVTSRSIVQYQRIGWPEGGRPRFAVTTNGGILLDGDEINPEWQETSQKLADPWQKEMARILALLPGVSPIKRYRMIDGLYLFAACDTPADAQAGASLFWGKTGLDVEISGRKIYFFPPPLNKGTAIDRLKEKFSPQKILCAGDSVIDLPMLRRGDAALVPHKDLLTGESPAAVLVPPPGVRFPDFVLQTVLSQTEQEPQRN